jgi:hypothetical protein
MIPGFETETAALTEYELTLIPMFCKGFANKVGKENAITNKSIIAGFKNLGIKLSESRVRKIINHIRVNGLIACLMATSDGYFISNDEGEIRSFIDSLISRERAIRQVRESIEYQLKSFIHKK